MREARVLFGFALASLGLGLSACRAASPAQAAAGQLVPAASGTQVASASSAPSVEPAATPLATCRAEPATVYGQEPVTFVVEGAAARQPLVAQLLDERGKLLQGVTLSVPGAFHPEGLGNGDFRLSLGPGAGCVVTINRELSRGSKGQTR